MGSFIFILKPFRRSPSLHMFLQLFGSHRRSSRLRRRRLRRLSTHGLGYLDLHVGREGAEILLLAASRSGSDLGVLEDFRCYIPMLQNGLPLQVAVLSLVIFGQLPGLLQVFYSLNLPKTSSWRVHPAFLCLDVVFFFGHGVDRNESSFMVRSKEQVKTRLGRD